MSALGISTVLHVGVAMALWYQSSACELAPLKQEDSALLGKYLLLYTRFPGICFFEFKS